MVTETIDDFDFSEIIKIVKDKEADRSLSSFKVAFLRNVTLDPIIPYLKFLFLEEGYNAEIYMGEFNNVFQDVLDTGSAFYSHDPNMIIICLKLEAVSERITRCFSSMSKEERNKDIADSMENINLTLSRIRENSNAMILIHNFEAPIHPCYGVYDYQKRFNQVNTIRNINLQRG